MPGQLKFKFKPSDLIERIEANRDKHAEDYAGALEGYYLELVDHFQAVIEAATKAKAAAADKTDPDFLPHLVARKPESHVGDYERVIDMLKLAQDETIELDEQQFAQYVRDEWDWKADFAATSAHYNEVRMSKLNP